MKLPKSKMRYWIEKHQRRRYSIKANLEKVLSTRVYTDGTTEDVIWHYSSKFDPYNWQDQDGVRYRINCLGQMQIGDFDFDRWANSVAGSVQLKFPLTEPQFVAALTDLKHQRRLHISRVA